MKQLDVPRLHFGLEQTFGLDAVYLSSQRQNAMVYLVSSLVMPMSVGSVQEREQTRYTVARYPAAPKNAHHKLMLLQSAGTATALQLEEDGYDAYAWGIDEPLIVSKGVVEQPELEQTLSEWTLGAYVLTATAGRKLAEFAWVHDESLAGIREESQKLINQGDYLVKLGQEMLDEFCI